ncbi:MAG: S-layer homology domain-containing protein [Clostridia bacterium]|nr:S-layer homology domain-containing protein [Clostridia bacterium]
MKKVLGIVISLSLIMASFAVPALADGVSFNDIDASHWAYSSVMTLVNEGTVKGYEDGGFHPNGTVTRAEFVKMIGKGETVRTEPYADVPADHWGYEYIMASGLKTDGNNFEPSTPIKRGEVLELIWTRNGSVTGINASGAVERQWSVPEAAAWGYTYGIMIGNDGVNLRLDDSLTRAEAAALIIRGRNYASATPINFEDTVSADTLKLILQMSKAFDGDISNLDRKLTNGEIALATMRIMEGESDPFVLNYPSTASDCKNGHAWAYVAYNYLNNPDFSEQMVNSVAKLSDSVAALSMGALGGSKSATKPFEPAGYPGIPMAGKLKLSLPTAKGAGVEFRADGTFDANKETTLKDAALILLQLNSIYGMEESYIKDKIQDEHYQTDMTKFPANYTEYPSILKSVPASVYEAADYQQGFVSAYEFARGFPAFQFNTLTRLAEGRSADGYTISFCYYPTMVKSNAESYLLMKVKVLVSGDTAGKTFKDVFGEQFIGEDAPLGECFVEIATKTPMNTAIYPEEDLIITKIIGQEAK